LRAANISLKGLDLSDVLQMDLTEREKQSLNLAKGDVVLAEASGSPSYVGRCVIWNEEIADCCFQNTVIRFRPHAVLPEYALVVFRYFLYASVFARTAHGVGIQHLGGSRFSQLEMPIPSASEQQRIVYAVTQRLERVAAAETSLESAARGIEEQTTIVIESVATGQFGALASNAGITESDLPRKQPKTDIPPLASISIPDSWAWSRVADVGACKKGKVREPKHEQGEHVKPYLRVANVLEDHIDTTELLRMNFTPAEQDAFRLAAGDVLLNEGQSANLVGRPAIYRGDPEDVYFQNHLIRFRPSSVVDSEFALFVFRHFLRAGVFRSIARWSTNIATLGLKRFSELPFPLPPLPVQKELVRLGRAKLAQLDKQRVTVGASRSGVEEMRREIYAAAVRGELSARVAGEESAHAMLARLGPPPKDRQPTRPGGTTVEAEPDGVSDEPRELTATLKRDGGRSSAEDLFAAAGYDRDLTKDVEWFYLALRDSLGKSMQPDGFEGGRFMLKVTPDAT
jgi:type I restriction enzyme S subunit